MDSIIVLILISVLIFDNCIKSECTKLVRPTVCLQNINTNEMKFEMAYVDQDVLVGKDVLIDGQLILDNIACICGSERCVCPTGAVGPQGPQGIQGEAGITGLVGPAGPEGPVGPAGSAGPMGLEGSAAPPPSFREHYLFAVRDSDSVGRQGIGDQTVPVELEIAVTDDWGVGSGRAFVAPATGLYEVIYEVRCFNELAGITNFVMNVRLSRNGVEVPNSVLSVFFLDSLGYADVSTVRYTTLVFLDQGDLLALLAGGGPDVFILGSDGINAVLVAIYLGNPNGTE